MNYRLVSKGSISKEPERLGSEMVLSDSESETIKQSPRIGQTRTAGKSPTTPAIYGQLNESRPHSTEPVDILPSGTERSSNFNSPRRMASQREGVTSSEFNLPSIRSSMKGEEFGFYSSMRRKMPLLESTNSFGPIFR